MKLLTALIEALRTAALDLLRRPLSCVVAILSMSLAVFLIGAFLIVARGADQLIARLEDDAIVEIYLRSETSNEDAAKFQAEISSWDGVARVESIDSARALVEFRAQFPDLGDIEALLGANPFPASLRVWPQVPDPAQLERLVAQAKREGIVDAVRYDYEWIRSLAELNAITRAAILLVCAVLLLTAWTIVGAVVRLALDDKRDEVALMQLAGASVPFVLAPLIVAGAIIGLSAAVFAMIALGQAQAMLLSWSQSSPLVGFLGMLIGRPLLPEHQLWLCAGSVISGSVAALMAAGRRVLR
jgi:cell division transport system permease protein